MFIQKSSTVRGSLDQMERSIILNALARQSASEVEFLKKNTNMPEHARKSMLDALERRAMLGNALNKSANIYLEFPTDEQK
jgi:hypothetical protein